MPDQGSKLTDNQLATLATLQMKLSALGIDGEMQSEVVEGPVITLYRFAPKNATRVSMIEGLSNDLALALGTESIQIRRLPGEPNVGIFVPNKDPKLLLFRDAVGEVWKQGSEMKIPIILGMDHMGKIVVEDLTLLPHLLIAGSTGSGKSTLLNSILSSIMYCKTTREVKIVLSDTKQVEFTQFAGAPHLLYPVATSVSETLDLLDDLMNMVDIRLSRLAKSGCQNILQYNVKTPDSPLPYILLVIDELADPLEDPTKDEETKKKYSALAEFRLGKIVQKARATGIHVIAATQRPSVKVVEGNIKSNFPARLTFKLPSAIDSRTIINTGGAEQLLMRGDMLYISSNHPAVRRIHAPLASPEDIAAAIEIASRREGL